MRRYKSNERVFIYTNLSCLFLYLLVKHINNIKKKILESNVAWLGFLISFKYVFYIFRLINCFVPNWRYIITAENICKHQNLRLLKIWSFIWSIKSPSFSCSNYLLVKAPKWNWMSLMISKCRGNGTVLVFSFLWILYWQV